MAQRRIVQLTDEKRAELRRIRDTAEKPYLRERAAALMRVADGQSACAVARTGLLKPHDPDTTYAWLDRHEAEGVKGLIGRPGRGRKPAFSPSTSDRGGGSGRGAPHRRA